MVNGRVNISVWERVTTVEHTRLQEIRHHVDDQRALDDVERVSNVELKPVFVPAYPYNKTCQKWQGSKGRLVNEVGVHKGSPTKTRLLVLATTCITVSCAGNEIHSKFQLRSMQEVRTRTPLVISNY